MKSSSYGATCPPNLDDQHGPQIPEFPRGIVLGHDEHLVYPMRMSSSNSRFRLFVFAAFSARRFALNLSIIPAIEL